MLVARHFVVWALLSWAAAAWAQQGGDYQAQILYAYQTEDTNSLANLSQDLTARVKEDGNDASLRYHLAHAQYRRGLLAGTPRAHEAETAFADCIDQLKPVLSQDVKSVEALVLQSACYAGLADHRKFESVLLRSRSDERLNAALNSVAETLSVPSPAEMPIPEVSFQQDLLDYSQPVPQPSPVVPPRPGWHD